MNDSKALVYDLGSFIGVSELKRPPPEFEYDDATKQYVTRQHKALKASGRAAACRWPDSIWGHYYMLSLHSQCAGSRASSYPSSALLRHAIQRYVSTGNSQSDDNSSLIELAKKHSTLVIHLSPSTNATFSRSYLQGLASLVSRSADVLFIAINGTAHETDTMVRKLTSKMMHTAPVETHTITAPQMSDDLLVIMASARHLLVHTGDDAAVAAIACAGTVYHDLYQITAFATSDVYKWSSVRDLRDLNHFPRAKHESNYVQQLRSLIQLREHSCCDIEHFGKGDGDKYICTNTRSLNGMHNSQSSSDENTDETKAVVPVREAMGDGCWILSIGCGGMWDFERLVTNRWKQCVVHLFDCTKNFIVPNDLRERVTLHKLCVAPAPTNVFNKTQYITLRDMIRIGSDSVQRDNTTTLMPALFKFDAEGVEYPVLNKMLDDTPRAMLPKQMIIEFHLRMPHRLDGWVRKGHMFDIPFVTARNLFDRLEGVGYSTVYRADNPVDEACTEVTMVLEDDLPMPVVKKQGVNQVTRL